MDIDFNKKINAVQLLEELGTKGIDVNGITSDKDDKHIIHLQKETDKAEINASINAHSPVKELTDRQKVDSIQSLEDVKKFLKGEL